MKLNLYHGSSEIVRKPEYVRGKPYNDYGLGFYCTLEADMAKEWSVRETSDGFANRYSIDIDGLKILHLESDEYNVLNWLAILLENRTFTVSSPLALEGREYLLANFLVDYKSCDIISGYRADDSYFAYAFDFINGAVSLRQLSEAIKLGKLGIQYVVKSRLAFSLLVFEDAEVALRSTWYEARLRRDKKARADYADSRKNKREKGDLFITHILDEEIKTNDPRLF